MIATTRVKSGFLSLGLLWITLFGAPQADANDFVSDDFNSHCEQPRHYWTFENPVDDATVEFFGAGTGEAQMLITLPASVAHDLWRAPLDSPRLLQSIADEDFSLEAKFDSVMDPLVHQVQGLMVRQDALNLLRFDFIAAGSSIFVRAAALDNGRPRHKGLTITAAGSPLWMRVERSGDQWTLRYSHDGTNWIDAASFSHALTASEAGVFCGNLSVHHGFTGRRLGGLSSVQTLVDYVFETSSPIIPEDDPNDAGPFDLEATTVGRGTVTRDPDLPEYDCGTEITLTAIPDEADWSFAGWSGDLESQDNPLTITLEADLALVATFVPDTTPPILTNLQVARTDTTATITWDTDQPASSRVDFGLGTGYELGFVEDATLVTQHSLTLQGLDPQTTYHFLASSTNENDQSVDSGDQTFTTLMAPPVISDLTVTVTYDSATLSWTTDIPSTSRVDFGLTDGYELGFVEDPALVTNHTIELEGLSPTTVYHYLVSSNNQDGLTGDAGDRTLITASPPPAISNIQVNVTDATATITWSTDLPSTSRVDYGLTAGYEIGFEEDPTLVTEHTIVLNNLAPSTLHHFQVTSVNADGYPTSSTDQTFTTLQAPPVISNIAVTVDDTTATITWNTDVPATSRVNYGLTAGYEIGFEEDPTLVTNHSLVLSNLASQTLHHFQVTSANDDGIDAQSGDQTFTTFVARPNITNVAVVVDDTTATVTWNTDVPATSRVDYGLTAGYEIGFEEDPALVTNHSLVLSNLAPETLHHFQITSVNQDGLDALSGDQSFTTFQAPPVISNIAFTVDDVSATITWNTDIPASSRVDYGLTTGYEIGFEEDPTLVTNHSLILSNLASETLHHFQITSTNGDGIDAQSSDQTFTTFVARPTLSNIAVVVDDTTATVTWNTDVPATSRVDYGLTAGYEIGFEEDPALVTNHSLVLSNLAPETLHHFQITSVNQDGLDVLSGDQTFTTFQAPPVISNVAITVDDVSATITWNTDIPATSRVDYGLTAGYEIGFEEDPTLVTDHSLVLSNLASETLHHFQITSANGDGLEAQSGDQTFTTFVARPTISNIAVVVDDTTATVTWTTDVPANSRVDYGLTTGYEIGFESDPALVTDHSLVLSSLSPETLHHFQITSVNQDGLDVLSGDQTFTTFQAPPVISNVAITVDDVSATIAWNTDIPATSRVDYGLTAGYEIGFEEDPTLATDHSLVLSNLASETLHHFQITSANGDGLEAQSGDQTFTTFVARPTISNIAVVVDDTTATVTWTTDVPADSRVDYGLTTGYEIGFESDPALVTDHSLVLSNLAPETLHHFQITSINQDGLDVLSGDQTFTTFQAPPVITNIAVTVEDVTATITWNTDIPATSRVDYGLSAGYEIGFEEDPTLVTDHTVVLSGLATETLHHFMVTSANGDGLDTNSSDQTFTTLIARPIIANISASLTDTTATITWNTKVPATSRIDYGLTEDHELGTEEDLTLKTSHSLTLTGLTPSTLYNYQITSVNADDLEDQICDLILMTYAGPPVLSNIQVLLDDTEATITWDTDIPATSRVDFGLTGGYELGFVEDETLVTSHSIQLTGLTPQTLHHFQITSANGDGIDVQSGDQTFTTLEAAPILSNIQVALTDTTATITWDTDIPSSSRINYGLTGGYELGFVEDPTLVTNHSLVLNGLAAGTLHHYEITSVNGDGVDTRSGDLTFTTFAAPPVISNIQVEVTDTTASISWDTDIPATSRVDFGLTTGYELGFDEDPSLVLEHVITLTGLASGTLHHFEITSANADGLETLSGDQTFTTFQAAPVISNIQVIPTQTGATITWDTDIAATSRVDYGETTGYELGFVDDPTLVTSHSVELAALSPGREYHYKVGSTNGDGLSSESGDQTFLTDADAPVISNIAVQVTTDSATITWTTDIPADSRVDYGLTNGYEIGFVEDPTLVTDHTLVLTGLQSQTLYHYEITTTNIHGVSTVSGDLTFTTDASADPSGILSDDFNIACAVLDSFWTFVDPLNDSSYAVTGVGTSNAAVEIQLPAGTNHNAWTTGLDVPRVMQSANDTDMEIEVSFLSTLTQGTQGQGVLIYASDDHFIRLEFYDTGSAFHVFAATIDNGVATTVHDITVPEVPFMKVTRTGDSWVHAYSADGQSWTSLPAFSHTIGVVSVGVYGLNYSGGSAPAHTAIVDYFFNTASPIDPEDGQVRGDSGDKTLTVTISGNGSVTKDPDLPTYSCGQAVTLTATPDPGSEFVEWQGDLTGSENPVTVTMLTDKNITASFQLDVSPPIISDVNVSAGHDQAIVTWTTNEAADSRVDYGETSGYELGFESNPALVTSHSLIITNLTADTTYHYKISSMDVNGLTGETGDLTFQTESEPGPDGSGIDSDDFDIDNLDTMWTFVNPLDDAHVRLIGAGTADASIEIVLPEGNNHEILTSNSTAARIMQNASDTDFEIEVKFDSGFDSRYQIQGLLVQQDDSHFVRTDFHYNGSSWRMFVATYTNGSVDTKANIQITPGSPLYMRLNRTTSTFTIDYGYDGTQWTQAAVFNHSLTVTSTGIFAGNISPNGTDPAPAFTCEVDYFFNNTSRIFPEDGNVRPDVLAPLIQVVRSASGKEAALVSWKTDEPSNSTVRYGETVSYELGTVNDEIMTRDHSVLIPNLQSNTTYYFEASSEDAVFLTSFTEGQFDTAPLTPPTGPVIDVWYGTHKTYGAVGVPQNYINILGNATAANGISSLTYELNGGNPVYLSMGPDDYRLADLGDFNADILFSALNSGQNYVVLRAIDTLGEETVDVVVIDNIVGNNWPLPYSIDWSQVAEVEDVSQVVDGDWGISANGLVSHQLDYDRVVVVGDHTTWTDYEATVPITVHALDPNGYSAPSNSPAVGVILRWPGHVDFDNGAVQPLRGWYPLGAIGLFRFNEIGAPTHRLQIYGDAGLILGTEDQVVELDTEYIFKMRVETIDATFSQYSLKVWKSSEVEPPDWNIQALHDHGTKQGSFAFLAHHVDCTFGNLTVTPLGQ